MVKWNGPFRSDGSNREKRSTSKGGPLFSKLFRLDLTDPFSFRPKFPEILVEWIALKGRFPFDQIFRVEIPGIPCDEWNSIFRFQVWRENGGLFYLCLLASGCSIDDAEVKINDVLGEGDNTTYNSVIVRI